MADDSSKLKAQIAFLTDLIKSHKQTTRASIDRRHVSSGHSNNNNSTRSFSWQRSKQPGVGKQHVGTSRDDTQSQATITKSSYSLDRRKTTNNSSGLKTMTATSSLKAPAIPGSSGLHPVLTMKNVKPSAFNDQTSTEQTASVLSSSKPTVSSRTTTLPSPAVSPIKSSNMTQSVASLAVKKNPYVLNKKGSLSVSSLKPIAQKSELKWSKSSATNSVLLTDDGKRHSDLELYTKKSSSVNTGQPSSVLSTKGKSPALIQYKVRPSSNVQGAFKWSKLSRISNNPGEKKSGKKPKLARSKLKWTNPGINSKSGTKMQGNPYVLNKGNLASGSTTQKQGIAVSKTISKHKLTKKAVYSAPGQSSLVWRAPGTLKLDRRKVQSTMASVNRKASIRRPSAGFMERRQRAVLKDSPVVTRYSVVRLKRKQAPIKAQKLNKVVVIGGVPYKTSSNKLTKTKATTKKESESKMTRFSRARKIGKLSKTVTIQGEKFIMDSKGKSLQRVNRVPQRGSMSGASSSKQSQVLAGRRRSSNGRTIVLRTPTTLVRSKVSNSQTKTVASRVLRRSIHNARLYKKNKQKPASEQYCMFYNRFGKCNKRDTCPYIHDPSKVAVCTKFLRGRCKNIDGTCPFSHKIDRDKMPVCQFFLRGKCTNDNCPYSHVNVSKKAAVCEDFLKGFCPLGQQCNKKHILECEEFSRTGKCIKGSKCKLMHRTRKPAARKRKTSPVEEEGNLKLSRLDFTNDEGFMPLTASVADSEQTSAQEPLENTPDETKQMAGES